MERAVCFPHSYGNEDPLSKQLPSVVLVSDSCCTILTRVVAILDSSRLLCIFYSVLSVPYTVISNTINRWQLIMIIFIAQVS